MFEKLLQNKSFKSLLMSQFKNIVKDNGVKHIIINVSENGELGEITIYKENIRIIKESEYSHYKNYLEKLKSSL